MYAGGRYRIGKDVSTERVGAMEGAREEEWNRGGTDGKEVGKGVGAVGVWVVAESQRAACWEECLPFEEEG